MPNNPAKLYEKDFVRWTEVRAATLRKAACLGINLPLDWENLAEEIESLGRSQRRELRSRIATIIVHLLKLQCSPAADPWANWIETIARERASIEDLLDDSPSLRNELAETVMRETLRAVKRVARGLRHYGETSPNTMALIENAKFSEVQVLDDWFPGDDPNSVPLPGAGERGKR
ncbi:MAG: DUF29 domain-containing protein [Alphaproteobacteria bacterium]|nr:DUF29 domain-containing protein [Alphaproteobacteria bacterium]